MEMRQWEKDFVDSLDIEYSYELARKMEQFKSNPVLGYRTAGSRAEFETGEMLFREMKALGLSQVCKDRVKVDAWEFEKAIMTFQDSEGKNRQFQLGAYQTSFDTAGPREYSLIYLGKGSARCYDQVDAAGRLVLVDINQRDEWWINFPVYQAWLKGAAALIAVQEQGYGEIDSTALNAQDIAGPEYAPAFSISQADARILKEALAQSPQGEIKVVFDARTTVLKDRETYNITGCIPGQDARQMILLSAHYDSYFAGFQDDNAAVSMMLGIAKAMLKSGYRPRRTIVFCAMAAEEWGVVNSKYDWSTGAYEQVFSAHPDWAGRTVADLNFELPARAHGPKDRVRCTYEYLDFVQKFLEKIQVDPQAYPQGVEAVCPIQTWSDDFSMAIAGIPSMVNEFSDGEFMETHYHSQFDNEEYYQEPVYRFHHMLYGRLVMALDRTALAPLNFSAHFQAALQSVDRQLCVQAGAEMSRLEAAFAKAIQESSRLYSYICRVNARYGEYLDQGRTKEADRLYDDCRELQEKILKIFRKGQDYFVRLNWHDDVLFPQEAVQNNLRQIDQARACLEQGEVRQALEAIYGIDNNRYAFQFDKEVFEYFTRYVLDQPAERLKWGADRIMHHENLFDLVHSLQDKAEEEKPDVSLELEGLRQVARRQQDCCRDDIRYMTASAAKMAGWIRDSLAGEEPI